MTDKQQNYQNMAVATVGEMDANSTLWNANVKITASVNAVKATLTNINGVTGVQGQSAAGATKSEHSYWVSAAGKTEHVCMGLKAYYNDINDLTSFAIVNYTISDFLYSSKLEATQKMQLIHDKAATITIANLAPFNIVAVDITGLQTAITNFANSQPLHTIMKASNKAATTQLPVLFATLRGQLKQLDFLVGSMKVVQPTFVMNYTNTRKIINLGKTQQAIELHLMPKHFEGVFGKKFTSDDTFTVRNHSKNEMLAFLTDTPDIMPSQKGVKIGGGAELKLVVPKDFGGVFGHWLVVYNPNDLDDIQVTVILAHGKSLSSAQGLGNVADSAS